MPTILLLEDGEQRFGRVEKSLRAAMPFIHIRRVRSATEFRYALVTRTPQVVILCHPSSTYRSTSLAWEVAALRPSTKLIILAQESAEDVWRSFGDTVFEVVDEDGLAVAVAAALSAPRGASNLCPGGASSSTVDAAAIPIDTHRLKNRMAGLLAGLHALAAELRATAAETERIPEVADEYVDRLVDVVGDICAMVAAAEARPCDENHC